MPSTRRVAVIVGSLRRDSLNRKMAKALIAMAPASLALEIVEIGALPHYNQDDDASPPPASVAFKEKIAAADAVLFVTPEYNRSVPGVLKNAIDVASRPYGKSAWSGKPGAVIGISIGAIGTATAQQHLRNILAYLDMPTLGQPEAFIQLRDGLFDDAGGFANPDTKKFLQGWMDRYVAWVKKHAA